MMIFSLLSIIITSVRKSNWTWVFNEIVLRLYALHWYSLFAKKKGEKSNWLLFWERCLLFVYKNTSITNTYIMRKSSFQYFHVDKKCFSLFNNVWEIDASMYWGPLLSNLKYKAKNVRKTVRSTLFIFSFRRLYFWLCICT